MVVFGVRFGVDFDFRIEPCAARISNSQSNYIVRTEYQDTSSKCI